MFLYVQVVRVMFSIIKKAMKHHGNIYERIKFFYHHEFTKTVFHKTVLIYSIPDIFTDN